MSTRTRLLIVLAVVALMVVAFAVPAFAAGKSQVGHVYVYAKTVASPTYIRIPGGAWGKMNYKISGNVLGSFVFNAQMLTPGDTYVLINYTGYANTQNILGHAVAQPDGTVHIRGVYGPALVSETPADSVTPGAKIWLVNSKLLSSDYTTFIGWDPSLILFEGKVIALPLH